MIRDPFPPLSSNCLSYLSDTDKAGCIDYFFTFCFNKSVQSLNCSPPSTTIPCHSSFLYFENCVMSLISNLPGSDGIPHGCSNSSLIPLFILFATYPTSQYLQVLFYLNGKPVLFFLSPSLLLHLLPLLAIKLYLSFLLPVKILKNTSFLAL